MIYRFLILLAFLSVFSGSVFAHQYRGPLERKYDFRGGFIPIKPYYDGIYDDAIRSLMEFAVKCIESEHPVNGFIPESTPDVPLWISAMEAAGKHPPPSVELRLIYGLYYYDRTNIALQHLNYAIDKGAEPELWADCYFARANVVYQASRNGKALNFAVQMEKSPESQYEVVLPPPKKKGFWDFLFPAKKNVSSPKEERIPIREYNAIIIDCSKAISLMRSIDRYHSEAYLLRHKVYSRIPGHEKEAEEDLKFYNATRRGGNRAIILEEK